MNRLTYEQLRKNDDRQFADALALWLPFLQEECLHRQTPAQTEQEIRNGLQKRISIQGSRPDMHFEIARLNGEPVGIAMFAVDLGTVCGLLPPRTGTCMGLYIRPEYRRKGYGREFAAHIRKLLRADGASQLYVCPDPVTGTPFWSAIGFVDSGRQDPDERLPIFIGSTAELCFVPFNTKQPSHAELLFELMLPYSDELDAHLDRPTPPETVRRWIGSIPGMLGAHDRHLEFCYADGVPAGFWYGKVDHADHRGYVRPGYGYAMEFYVVPQFRRRGYGGAMLRRMETLFAADGAKTIYLTSDPVTGLPFWCAEGFALSGAVSPENGLPFCEKKISAPFCLRRATPADAAAIAELLSANLSALHQSAVSPQELEALLASPDADEAHYLLSRGGTDVAWLKLNGLAGTQTGWISMLAVRPEAVRRGAGEYAVYCAMRLLAEAGFEEIALKTSADNAAALGLYRKCGLAVTHRVPAVLADDTAVDLLTLRRRL